MRISEGQLVYLRNAVYPPGKPPIQQGTQLEVKSRWKSYVDLDWPMGGGKAIYYLHIENVTHSEDAARKTSSGMKLTKGWDGMLGGSNLE